MLAYEGVPDGAVGCARRCRKVRLRKVLRAVPAGAGGRGFGRAEVSMVRIECPDSQNRQR